MDIVELHERALDQAERIIAGITPDQLTLPTPCTDWDARALLNHMVAGNLRFARLAEGQGGPPPRGLPQEDLLGEDPAAAYRQSAEALKQAWRAPGRLDGLYRLPLGEVPGRAALGIRLVETVTHGWDLATATGQEPAFDQDIVQAASQLTRQQLGEDRPPGTPFGTPVPAPDGAPEIDRLAAFLGRQPQHV